MYQITDRVATGLQLARISQWGAREPTDGGLLLLLLPSCCLDGDRLSMASLHIWDAHLESELLFAKQASRSRRDGNIWSVAPQSQDTVLLPRECTAKEKKGEGGREREAVRDWRRRKLSLSH